MKDVFMKCLKCGCEYDIAWMQCPKCKLTKLASSVPSPEEEKLIASESKSQAVNQYEFSPIEEYLPNKFNEPSHYHTHEIDTIEFLKRGFPPEVLTGFLIGNIIKYTQRFQYKNGEDDINKIVDYSKRLQEWYKETH